MKRRKFKECFVNRHCCFDCPNFRVDEFEEFYDLPASEIGLERIKCKDCYFENGDCKNCLFEGYPECPEYNFGGERT